MALARDRGGALAALLATPPVGFDAGRRSDGSDGSDGSDWDEDVGGGIPSMDSALVDALTPDWRAGDGAADARTLATLAADTADDLAAAAADAKRRRRRKYRDDSRGDDDDDEPDEFARASHAPPLLPLALASHPSARVREAAAAALGERMAAVPSRAPATLPPLLLAVKAASFTKTEETTTTRRITDDSPPGDSPRGKARAVLASLRAATAGAAHPLGAPVALSALSPLVAPFEMDAGASPTSSSKEGVLPRAAATTR